MTGLCRVFAVDRSEPTIKQTSQGVLFGSIGGPCASSSTSVRISTAFATETATATACTAGTFRLRARGTNTYLRRSANGFNIRSTAQRSAGTEYRLDGVRLVDDELDRYWSHQNTNKEVETYAGGDNAEYPNRISCYFDDRNIQCTGDCQEDASFQICPISQFDEDLVLAHNKLRSDCVLYAFEAVCHGDPDNPVATTTSLATATTSFSSTIVTSISATTTAAGPVTCNVILDGGFENVPNDSLYTTNIQAGSLYRPGVQRRVPVQQRRGCYQTPYGNEFVRVGIYQGSTDNKLTQSVTGIIPDTEYTLSMSYLPVCTGRACGACVISFRIGGSRYDSVGIQASQTGWETYVPDIFLFGAPRASKFSIDVGCAGSPSSTSGLDVLVDNISLVSKSPACDGDNLPVDSTTVTTQQSMTSTTTSAVEIATSSTTTVTATSSTAQACSTGRD